MKLPLLLCLLAGSLSAAPETFSVTDFGAEPGSGNDASGAVRKALAACKGKEEAVLAFPKGRYDFHAPAGSTWGFQGIPVRGHKNLTIDGQGSLFVFHGMAGICGIENSENITVRNFTADWDSPYIAQGEIVDAQNDHVDIRFEMPYEITDGTPVFIGETWKRGIDGYTLLFDPKTCDILPQTRDYPLGYTESYTKNARDLGDNTIRFTFKPWMKPAPGTRIAIWLARYMMPGFDLRSNKNITLENITIHHALSHGVVAFKTEDLTLRRVDLLPNTQKDRLFSTVADGFHLATCKGLVTIEDCAQAGVGDDFLNIHGTHLLIRERPGAATLKVATSGKGGNTGSFAPGDEVWFVKTATAQRVGSARLLTRERDTLTFDAPLPPEIGEGDTLENKTWNARLEMRRCTITRKSRARGILVTTPCRAVIENNTFRTAGAAILIDGDTNYWYESGAVGDLTIRNNIFEDCLSSAYNGDWGQAVISITPSFHPKTETAEAYHRNIRIENNTFKAFDYPILYARSVRDLAFTGNTITRSETFKPFASRKITFFLDGCRNATIGANRYLGDVLGKNLKTKNMAPADLKLADREIVIQDN